jgi:hypothetical protein
MDSCLTCGRPFAAPGSYRRRYCDARCKARHAAREREARAPLERALRELVARLEETAAAARALLPGAGGRRGSR